MALKRIVILFSGEGSNLENLIKKLNNKSFGSTLIEVSAVITNNPSAGGIKRAKNLNVDCEVIEHEKFSSREEFDKVLVETIAQFQADLTVLAGFMRILTPVFTDNVKAINLHPSLLPLFKGANAIKRSFESDMKVGGVSVHWLSSELDGGKIIAQQCFQKEDGMDFAAFSKKIKELEYKILPETVVKVLEKKY